MDVLIPITGRRRSGKDTIAKVGVEQFSCAGSVALSDWFKKILSEHFRLPLEDFYSSKKDEELAKPIVIRRGDISRLLSKTSQLASKHVDVRYQKLSISKWEGREATTIRDLMLWWANDVITKSFGEVLHNVITLEAIKALPRKHAGDDNAFDVIFVTDARQHGQSSWFRANGFQHVYPLKIVRPLGTLDQSAPELATEEFPANYFFEEVVNDEDLPALQKKIQDVLGRIRVDLKSKLPRVQRSKPQTPKPQPPAVAQDDKKDTNA